jgi:hypothetical protein
MASLRKVPARQKLPGECSKEGWQQKECAPCRLFLHAESCGGMHTHSRAPSYGDAGLSVHHTALQMLQCCSVPASHPGHLCLV